jgi:hypothetical protein
MKKIERYIINKKQMELYQKLPFDRIININYIRKVSTSINIPVEKIDKYINILCWKNYLKTDMKKIGFKKYKKSYGKRYKWESGKGKTY